MRIGLVSFRCENKNLAFNLAQVRRAMEESRGKADLLCFGEAFLQGFECLCWNYAADRETALEQSSPAIAQLRQWTVQYGVSLITGYIERAREALYSSCIVLSEGRILHNYRRVSTGWKESSKTDHHYREGTDIRPFRVCGKEMLLALCGDLWDCPEKFKTDHLLIWPVYVNFSLEEWQAGLIEEYARQAALAARDALLINPIDLDPVNHGGAFRFRDGQVIDRIPFDEERILFVDVPS